MPCATREVVKLITLADVEHVAKLARLELSPEEKKDYSEQLSRIIEHFNALAAVDTEGVEPMCHALPIVNVMRDDVVIPPPGAATLLQSAPEAENGFFRVPKIGD